MYNSGQEVEILVLRARSLAGCAGLGMTAHFVSGVRIRTLPSHE